MGGPWSYTLEETLDGLEERDEESATVIQSPHPEDTVLMACIQVVVLIGGGGGSQSLAEDHSGKAVVRFVGE